MATSENYEKKLASRDTPWRATVRRKRRGITMIEMLVTISVSTMVLGTAILAVVMLMNMCSAERAHCETTAARGRLEWQFRADARAAASWDLATDDGSLCQFRMPDGSVINYRQDADAVIRLRLDADQTPTRERYLLLPDTVCEIALLDEPLAATFLQLTVNSPLNRKNEEVRLSYRTIASAGADQRFVQGTE